MTLQAEIYNLVVLICRDLDFRTLYFPPPSALHKFHRHLTFHIRSELQTKPYPHQETDLDLKFLVLSSNPKNLRSRTVFHQKRKHLGVIWETCGPQGAPRVIWATWVHFIDATLSPNANWEIFHNFLLCVVEGQLTKHCYLQRIWALTWPPGSQRGPPAHYQNRQNPYCLGNLHTWLSM